MLDRYGSAFSPGVTGQDPGPGPALDNSLISGSAVSSNRRSRKSRIKSQTLVANLFEKEDDINYPPKQDFTKMKEGITIYEDENENEETVVPEMNKVYYATQNFDSDDDDSDSQE